MLSLCNINCALCATQSHIILLHEQNDERISDFSQPDRLIYCMMSVSANFLSGNVAFLCAKTLFNGHIGDDIVVMKKVASQASRARLARGKGRMTVKRSVWLSNY
jgi:hypothetical protein